MQVILRRAKTFSQSHAGGPSIIKTYSPGTDPQEIPDWAAKTNTFVLGIADKSILELKEATPAEPEPEVIAAPARRGRPPKQSATDTE